MYERHPSVFNDNRYKCSNSTNAVQKSSSGTPLTSNFKPVLERFGSQHQFPC